MKALLMSVTCLTIVCSSAFAANRDYQCIADKMQAINSDIWYDISSQDIDTMIAIDMAGHSQAVRADKECTLENKQYTCIADSLQAINSDIWYNLSKSEVNLMLNNPAENGHSEAVAAAKRCGLN